MDDLISEFLTETAESLDVIDAELVRFENNPEDRAIISTSTTSKRCTHLGAPVSRKASVAPARLSAICETAASWCCCLTSM